MSNGHGRQRYAGLELFDGLSRRDVPAGAYSSDIHSVRVVELYDAARSGLCNNTNSRSRAAGVVANIAEGL